MNKLIRIGTKGSALARRQAAYIASLINPSGYQTEIHAFGTNEDHSKDGNLELKLLEGSIEVAVHSAKDLPSDLHDELELIAFTEREPANDVLISATKNLNLQSHHVKIGTTSIRREAFVKHFYPETRVVFVHGDLLTQIERMKQGACDALLVSYADVHHLDLDDMIVEKIETSYFVPAVGQGSIAIECHKKLAFDKKEVIQRWVNHEETEDCIRSERSFLKKLNKGYNIPAFGFAQYEGNLITLKAGVISLDGQHVVKAKRSSTVAESKELGKKVAQEVLQNGGDKILLEVAHAG